MAQFRRPPESGQPTLVEVGQAKRMRGDAHKVGYAPQRFRPVPKQLLGKHHQHIPKNPLIQADRGAVVHSPLVLPHVPPAYFDPPRFFGQSGFEGQRLHMAAREVGELRVGPFHWMAQKDHDAHLARMAVECVGRLGMDQIGGGELHAMLIGRSLTKAGFVLFDGLGKAGQSQSIAGTGGPPKVGKGKKLIFFLGVDPYQGVRA